MTRTGAAGPAETHWSAKINEHAVSVHKFWGAHWGKHKPRQTPGAASGFCAVMLSRALSAYPHSALPSMKGQQWSRGVGGIPAPGGWDVLHNGSLVSTRCQEPLSPPPWCSLLRDSSVGTVLA